MKVGDTQYRSIWFNDKIGRVQVIDQRWLPHEFRVVDLVTRADFATAIRDMWVRGAPLIGATAAHAIAEEMKHDASDANLHAAWDELHETRPTAINLRWALDRVSANLRQTAPDERFARAFAEAGRIAEEDVASCRAIGAHGGQIIAEIGRAHV